MTQTTIYLSVVRGNDSLTLDGALNLFGELLTTLSDASREIARKPTVLADCLPDQVHEEDAPQTTN
jgi:hypothetical protein